VLAVNDLSLGGQSVVGQAVAVGSDDPNDGSAHSKSGLGPEIMIKNDKKMIKSD
jgi:hypothetical protein